MSGSTALPAGAQRPASGMRGVNPRAEVTSPLERIAAVPAGAVLEPGAPTASAISIGPSTSDVSRTGISDVGSQELPADFCPELAAREAAVILGAVLGAVLLLGLFLSPVLLPVGALVLLVTGGWKLWRFKHRTERKVKRGRRRVRKAGKKAEKALAM